MTEGDFIFMHTYGIRNAPTKLHLNVTANSEFPKGDVTSLVIGQRAFSVNGDTNNTDLNSVLEQVENIKFTFLISGQDPIVVDVEATDKAYFGPTLTNGQPFFYIQFEPFQLDDIQNPPFNTELFEYQAVQVTLTPYLLDIQFGFSEYNALFGNALENRKSQIRVESNRDEDNVLPTNWEAIISGTAAPATIQDSLYEDSGWRRGRYDGSKINSRGNAGISPALNGTPFRGEIFTNDADNAFICSTNREQVTIEDMLHTSTTPLPKFVTSSIGLFVDGLTLTFPANTLYFQTASFPLTGSIEVGNILSIVNSDPAVGPTISGSELYLITSYDPINSPLTASVERGYAGTTITTHPNNAEVKLVQPFDIFKFEEGSTEYLRLVNDAKIYVQGNNTIVDTDKYGNVINEFQCEYIEYIVTD